MKSLYNYIRTFNIDGHRHVFSHRGDIAGGNCVGFMDIELDELDKYKDIPGMYDEYIKSHDSKNIRLLATGLTIEDIKAIYNAHPDVIKGFGELKLYGTLKGEPINRKHISFARDVCRFSEQVGGLPVYIHYILLEDREVRAFDKLLTDFPNVPIVLCHCGMCGHDQEYSWNAAKKLAWAHGNCWLDISWSAAEWLSKNPMLLTQIPTDRVFWGSDRSPIADAHNVPNADNSVFAKYFDSDANIQRLFAV